MSHDPAKVLELMKADCEGAFLNQFANAQKPRIVSIYRVPKGAPDSAIEHCGSGFLLFHKRRHFIVSAAHVWDDTEHFELGAYRKKDGRLDSRIFKGTKFTTPISTGGRDNDIIDVGVVPLTDDEVEFFGPTNFYIASECAPEERCRTSSLYTGLGFPNTKNEPNVYLDRLTTQPHSYSTHGASEDRFTALNVTPFSHVLLDLNPKKVSLSTGAVQTPPARRGMSGGPVFRFHDYASPDSALRLREPKLIAVFIENPRVGKLEVLVATNISFVLNLIPDPPVEAVTPSV